MLRDKFSIRNSSVVTAGLFSLFACTAENPKWQVVSPSKVGMDREKLIEAREYALKGGGSGYIMRSGRVVMKWGSETKRYDLKSTTKSIGISALGLALMDMRVDLDDRLIETFNELRRTRTAEGNNEWLNEVTLRRIAEQTAGFDKSGGYCDLLFEPGTVWAYSDCGPNWMADYLTFIFGKDLNELLHERVFRPIGISQDDLRWRENAYRDPKLQGIPRREFGSGILANIRAMALIGELYLRRGKWQGKQILPADFIDAVAQPNPRNEGLAVTNDRKGRHADAPKHYGLLWWNNSDGTMAEIPRDAYWSWGLHESFIFVIPSLDIVAVRTGNDWPGPRSANSYNILCGFLKPIVDSVNRGAPYPNSKLITGIKWSDEILRAADGSDNWPVTWASDGNLYTAYGDGWGFSPKLPEKVSLGIASVEGPPWDIMGKNIRSSTGEQFGDGASGKKASGMLMVDSTLYMWVRNANNEGKHCQLAWSNDNGVSWEWSSWTHTDIGYCVFLNYGRNYAGTRDEYIYTYSPDTDSAYVSSDHVVLARVRKLKIKQLATYEYFAGLNTEGEPIWSDSFNEHQPIFTFLAGCNRLDVVYNQGLEKYFLTMRSGWQPGGRDHWSLFESSTPWGPWSTVFYTEHWDIDPGEALRIPSKWLSPDGTAFALVFSGGDSFAIRRAELSIR
jgi:CubicO group peptidase (beta-lactamase class C family)